ncbi:MAG TPA: hypothetical protein VFF30_20300 [Nitrososphaerales archaeon]|nr:hypothetical protein [Nitrososphaerales archaeon]
MYRGVASAGSHRIEPEVPFLRRVIQIRDSDGNEQGKTSSNNEAIRIALVEVMARNGDPAATNMALGIPFYRLFSVQGYLRRRRSLYRSRHKRKLRKVSNTFIPSSFLPSE